MAFASFDRKSGSAPMSDINMVPLIDVMLVLLVIFIVTAPLLTHAVKLELPRADSQVDRLEPQRIDFAIDANGGRYWNGESITREEAAQRMVAAGGREPQPEIHLQVDRQAQYDHVAQLLSAASRHGLGKVAFVTEPGKP